MDESREFMLVYRERLVVYASGVILYLALTPYAESPVVLAVKPAISMWIAMSVVINAWMRLIKVAQDPSTHSLGIPNRVLDLIFLTMGLIVIAAATWYGSPDIGSWGCLFLTCALEGRVLERESWRRYRLEQRQKHTTSA